MTIKTLGFALAFVSLMSGPAGTAQTEKQPQKQTAAQDTDAVQSTDAVQDIDAAPVTDPLLSTDRVQIAHSNIYDPDAIKCKRIRKTGTRFTTKVCGTNREWEAAAENARKFIERVKRQSMYL